MSKEKNKLTTDIGLLCLRVAGGTMLLFGHGWGKIFNYSEKASSFGDPLGLGPEISLALAGGAEFFGSLLVILGLATRFASASVVFTMAVAAFIVHGGDGFGDMEMALLYASIFLTLGVTGAGRLSVDHVIKSRGS